MLDWSSRNSSPFCFPSCAYFYKRKLHCRNSSSWASNFSICCLKFLCYNWFRSMSSFSCLYLPYTSRFNSDSLCSLSSFSISNRFLSLSVSARLVSCKPAKSSLEMASCFSSAIFWFLAYSSDCRVSREITAMVSFSKLLWRYSDNLLYSYCFFSSTSFASYTILAYWVAWDSSNNAMTCICFFSSAFSCSNFYSSYCRSASTFDNCCLIILRLSLRLSRWCTIPSECLMLSTSLLT